MVQYEVIPYVGVGPVRLGMPRAEVRRNMPGEPVTFRKWPYTGPEVDAYHGTAFQVYYANDADTVEYIQVSRDQGVQALYLGLSVFDADADEVVRIVAEVAPFDPQDPELGYSYIFPALDMTLWRPVLPVSPDDSIGRQFSSIGIGVKGLYRNR